MNTLLIKKVFCQKGILSESYSLKRGSAVHIYITSDEEIKEGDFYLDINLKKVCKNINTNEVSFNTLRKIILTTDRDLINVQVIDDEFLEWFVKNPSCEEVEVVFNNRGITGAEKILKSFGEYEIIIPKEKPFKHSFKALTTEEVMEGRSNAYEFIDFDKQEILKEATKVAVKLSRHLEAIDQAMFIGGFQECIKWQAKKSFTNEEVLDILKAITIDLNKYIGREEIEKWFEQFRKK